MGIISLEKANHLYWLGRYLERTFSAIEYFDLWYDTNLEMDESSCEQFCQSLGIPNCYGTKAAFVQNYMYDLKDANSVIANLTRAYDNAIVMRDEIKTTSLAYIQMAADLMEKGSELSAPLMANQRVMDMLYAFWGSIEDCVIDYESRNIIKCGKWQERIDLYLRLDRNREVVRQSIDRMCIYSDRLELPHDRAALQEIRTLLTDSDNWDVPDILLKLRAVFPL